MAKRIAKKKQENQPLYGWRQVASLGGFNKRENFVLKTLFTEKDKMTLKDWCERMITIGLFTEVPATLKKFFK